MLIVAPALRKLSFKERVKALFGRGPVLPAPQKESHYALADLPIHVSDRQGLISPEDVPDADVIIATWWETAEWVWALPAAKGAKVHFIQGDDSSIDARRDRVDAVWRLPLFKIGVAKWLFDLGRERYGIERMALVPNSVDHQLFGAQKRCRREVRTVGFLHHQASFKDMPTTFATIRRLQELKPKTRVLAFGSAPPSNGELPKGTEFHLLPRQNEIAEIYARCDAWLSTSPREGFNLPPLEAMASGCPAVCARTGRPLEIIENGVNGYLIDSGDIAGFTDALASILSLSDSDWKRMSEAAIRSVAHPTWAESSALFEEALAHSVSDSSL